MFFVINLNINSQHVKIKLKSYIVCRARVPKYQQICKQFEGGCARCDGGGDVRSPDKPTTI